jgi:hypothetical protein
LDSIDRLVAGSPPLGLQRILTACPLSQKFATDTDIEQGTALWRARRPWTSSRVPASTAVSACMHAHSLPHGTTHRHSEITSMARVNLSTPSAPFPQQTRTQTPNPPLLRPQNTLPKHTQPPSGASGSSATPTATTASPPPSSPWPCTSSSAPPSADSRSRPPSPPRSARPSPWRHPAPAAPLPPPPPPAGPHRSSSNSRAPSPSPPPAPPPPPPSCPHPPPRPSPPLRRSAPPPPSPSSASQPAAVGAPPPRKPLACWAKSRRR